MEDSSGDDVLQMWDREACLWSSFARLRGDDGCLDADKLAVILAEAFGSEPSCFREAQAAPRVSFEALRDAFNRLKDDSLHHYVESDQDNIEERCTRTCLCETTSSASTATSYQDPLCTRSSQHDGEDASEWVVRTQVRCGPRCQLDIVCPPCVSPDGACASLLRDRAAGIFF